jgi:hypothetical protein
MYVKTAHKKAKIKGRMNNNNMPMLCMYVKTAHKKAKIKGRMNNNNMPMLCVGT